MEYLRKISLFLYNFVYLIKKMLSLSHAVHTLDSLLKNVLEVIKFYILTEKQFRLFQVHLL